MRIPTSFALGAATAFFLDPTLGKRRRHQLRDRSLKALRRGARFLLGKGRLAAGHARGAAHETRSALAPDAPADDVTVRQRILSDAFRGLSQEVGHVQVEVRDGVALLSGSVPEESLVDDLTERVRKVPGVSEVDPRLRVVPAGAAS